MTNNVGRAMATLPDGTQVPLDDLLRFAMGGTAPAGADDPPDAGQQPAPDAGQADTPAGLSDTEVERLLHVALSTRPGNPWKSRAASGVKL